MIGNARLAACVADAYRPAEPKVSPLQAQVISGAYSRGTPQKQLSKMYGVSQATISRSITEHLRTIEAPATVGASLLPKENQ